MSSLLRRIIRHPLRMGGHGHSHGGEARLFGEPANRKKESWELWYNIAVGGTAVFAIGLAYRQNANAQDWARDEAEERSRRKEAGLPVEYGVNYAGIRYMRERNVISNEEAERLENGEIPSPHSRAVMSPRNV